MTQQIYQQKAKFTAENLRENLEKLLFTVSELSKKQYNYEFDVKQGKSKAKVLIFFGNKGIKTIIQGNKNDELYKELDTLIFGKLPFETPNLVEPSEYIGSDESGKGDFFGPLIVCAFAFDIKIKDELLKLNVKDSKELEDDEILNIYKEITNKFPARYEVVEIHPPKYNQLYEKMNNLNDILIWAHLKAIKNLSERFNYRIFIIDKFAPEHRFNGNFLKNHKLLLEEKAEKFVGVAAASIIARARLLNWFEKKNKELGFSLPLGGSKDVTKFAQKIKTMKDEKFLKDLIKLHFKNFKEID